MIGPVCLWVCVWSAGQPALAADWDLTLHLARGQEVVYRGSFREQSLRSHVHWDHTYELEARFLVTEERARGWQVALWTAWTRSSGAAGSATPSSVHLEIAEVDRQGRLRGSPALVPPLDGPPPLECGFFLEVPARRIRLGESWSVQEPGRPPRTWRAQGVEMVGGRACLKLTAEQQSPDWDHPRADATAWWRRDTVWLAPTLGLVYRLERELRQRAPAHTQVTYRAWTRYECDHFLTYPVPLLEDRRETVLQAWQFQQQAESLLRQAAPSRAALEALRRRVTYFVEDRPRSLPYRLALLQVQHRLEAALRGETVPADLPQPRAAPLAPGRRAPDFLVTEVVQNKTLRLYQFAGRPLVLIFYHPTAEASQQVLAFACQLSKQHPEVAFLALARDGEPAQLARQHAQLHLPFPVADGRGLYQSFGVEVTPQVLLLDADAIVCAVFTGWSAQTGQQLTEAVQRLCQQQRKPEKTHQPGGG